MLKTTPARATSAGVDATVAPSLSNACARRDPGVTPSSAVAWVTPGGPFTRSGAVLD
jgi:hypothetical protein